MKRFCFYMFLVDMVLLYLFVQLDNQCLYDDNLLIKIKFLSELFFHHFHILNMSVEMYASILQCLFELSLYLPEDYVFFHISYLHLDININ